MVAPQIGDVILNTDNEVYIVIAVQEQRHQGFLLVTLVSDGMAPFKWTWKVNSIHWATRLKLIRNGKLVPLTEIRHPLDQDIDC